MLPSTVEKNKVRFRLSSWVTTCGVSKNNCVWFTSLVADFSIRSLESFWSRAALTAGEGSGAAVRKRPHYDNRLRRLNAKHFVRRSHLGVEPDSTSWK